MKVPIQRYHHSGRPYEEKVRDWEYPMGSLVRRLNSQGMLSEDRQRWFVCGALRDQLVRVERFDGKLLVSYRHMYIREIDPQRGFTRPLVVTRMPFDAPSFWTVPNRSRTALTPTVCL